jgi:hypothetical protein
MSIDNAGEPSRALSDEAVSVVSSAREASSEAVEKQSETVAKQPLTEPARDYLLQLLRDIGTMLSYANNNGIPLPDDLREKIGELFSDSDVNNLPLSSTRQRLAK